MNRIEKDTCKVSFSIPFNIFFDEQSYLCLLLTLFDARLLIFHFTRLFILQQKNLFLKTKIPLFYKYIFASCRNAQKSDQLLLIVVYISYILKYMLDFLLRITEVSKFLSISSLTTASFGVY